MSELNTRTNTISFVERKASSAAFHKLYADGMGLVEETAAYLDGDGRAEAKKLSRIAATLYAAESMRLTTRLMQIASWLLLQRALNSGEMSREQMVLLRSAFGAGSAQGSGAFRAAGALAGERDERPATVAFPVAG